MSGLLTLRNFLWLITTATEVVLFLFLFRRKLQTTHAAFATYIFSTIAQSALAASVYSRWGYNTSLASNAIWASQGVVICLRFTAVYEMARRILSGYAGLWSLAKRLLAAIGLSTVAYSLLVAKKEFFLLVLNLDRGLELAISAFVVSLLLFARFQMLPVQPLERALAIGFSMYSCFYAINDTLFEKLLNAYLPLWGYLDILTFLASLLIWMQAVWTLSKGRSLAGGPEWISRSMYATLSPELNVRLKQLNEEVSQLLRVEKQSS
jgi:hypothetical protein